MSGISCKFLLLWFLLIAVKVEAGESIQVERKIEAQWEQVGVGLSTSFQELHSACWQRLTQLEQDIKSEQESGKKIAMQQEEEEAKQTAWQQKKKKYGLFGNLGVLLGLGAVVYGMKANNSSCTGVGGTAAVGSWYCSNSAIQAIDRKLDKINNKIDTLGKKSDLHTQALAGLMRGQKELLTAVDILKKNLSEKIDTNESNRAKDQQVLLGELAEVRKALDTLTKQGVKIGQETIKAACRPLLAQIQDLNRRLGAIEGGIAKLTSLVQMGIQITGQSFLMLGSANRSRTIPRSFLFGVNRSNVTEVIPEEVDEKRRNAREHVPTASAFNILSLNQLALLPSHRSGVKYFGLGSDAVGFLAAHRRYGKGFLAVMPKAT